jgi:hypothetical protein
MNDETAFLDRPENSSGIEALADRCLEVIEEGGDENGFPNPRSFLEERDLAVPEGAEIRLEYAVVPKGKEPKKKERCYLRCKEMYGDTYCIWVCV